MKIHPSNYCHETHPRPWAGWDGETCLTTAWCPLSPDGSGPQPTTETACFHFPLDTSEPPCTGLPTTLQRIEPCSYHPLYAPGLTHHPPPSRKQPVISNPSRVWSRGSLPCAPMELEALAKKEGPILRPQPLKCTHHPVGVLAHS